MKRFENFKNDRELKNKRSFKQVYWIGESNEYCEEIENKKLIEKVLGFFLEIFDPVMLDIEEIKYLDTLKLQDLMSLLSIWRKLIQHPKKFIDNTFQFKLNVGYKNYEKNYSYDNQSKGESSRGGRQAKGRGRSLKEEANEVLIEI